MKQILFFTISLLCVVNTNAQSNSTKLTGTLDFNQYLKLADGDKVYPSEKQMEMLKTIVPKQTFMPAPAYTDRSYWEKVVASELGKEVLQTAKKVLDKKPEIPISDEVYREANRLGNRGMYKPKYYNTMERLEYFMLAECMENKGRFLPQIETYIGAIMEMKSWMHPNHDKDNKNLDGKTISIDLGARKFGSVLVEANILLADKLPVPLKKEIAAIAQQRITTSYLNSCKQDNDLNTWRRATSNWNSVCTSGSLFVTIANSTDENERLAVIGCTLNGMKYYLSGFGQDGYCSEGAGYWGYGFGHYLYIAQILMDYTGGKINLFDAGNPEKLKNVGNFIQNFEIHNSKCAPFSDGVSSIASNSGSNFAAAMSAAHYGAIKPTEFRFEEAAERFIAWENPDIFTVEKNANLSVRELPDHSYFDDFGMVISRGKQQTPFSIAIKAGHNAENHNHSDVGTYSIFLGNDYMTGDIGAPSYTAGAFNQDNKARSSWGHPVPRINNTLQSNGRQFEGKIIATKFEKESDEVTMDIGAAYKIPELKELKRTMHNNKSGNGTITIEDKFSATKPVTFGVAIMTFSKYEIVNNSTIIVSSKNQKMKVEVVGNGAAIKITDEQVPVKALREGGPAYRIGVDFINPVKEGSIIVKYTPVL